MTVHEVRMRLLTMPGDAKFLVQTGDSLIEFTAECIQEARDGNSVTLDLTPAECSVIDEQSQG